MLDSIVTTTFLSMFHHVPDGSAEIKFDYSRLALAEKIVF